MLNKIVGAILTPKKTLQKEVQNARWSTSFLLYFISFVIILLSAFLVVLTNIDPGRELGQIAFQTLIGKFVLIWFTSFIAKKLGGKGNFSKLYYLSSLWVVPVSLLTLLWYFTAPFIEGLNLSIISSIIILLLYLYELYIFYIAIKVVHNLSSGKIIAAIVGSIILLFILSLLLVVALVILINPPTFS